MERKAPRKRWKQVAPGQVPVSFIHQAFIKPLLCARLKARTNAGLMHRGGRTDVWGGWVLGGQWGAGFRPLEPSTGLITWGEEPLSQRNYVMAGWVPGGASETHLRKWKRGKEWRERSGERRTLTGVCMDKEGKSVWGLRCSLLLHTGFRFGKMVTENLLISDIFDCSENNSFNMNKHFIVSQHFIIFN